MQPLVPFRHQGPLQVDAADLKTLPHIRELVGRLVLRVWIGPDASITMLLDPDKILMVRLDEPPIPGMRQSPMTIMVGVALPDQDWSGVAVWEVKELNGQRFSGITKNVVCFGADLQAIVGPHSIAIGKRLA